MPYNLLEEEWIPVLYRDGHPQRIGVCRALGDAARIRQIAAVNPMDRLAILRFLLALLYWCKGSPPPSGGDDEHGHFPPEWFAKLEENKNSFDLLGEDKRFYQYKAPGDEPRLTANYLIHEIPTGTNIHHFRHSTDGAQGLCPACCAMGLLRLPVFSTSGGRGKPPGINAKPPAYALPLGGSLAHTLRLLWVPVPQLGNPAWLQPELRLPESGDVPLLTGLTWLPRRVWLGDPETTEAACVSCGCRQRLIVKCVFAAIGSAKIAEGGPGRQWRDPHVIYERNAKGDIMAIGARDALSASDAAAYQRSAITASALQKWAVSGNTRTGLWVIGFSTVQNDKYLEAVECTLSATATPQEAERLVEAIDHRQKAKQQAEKKLGKAVRSRGASRVAVSAFRPLVEEKFAAASGAPATGDEAGEAARQCRNAMETIAAALSPGFTSAALRRRCAMTGATSAKPARQTKGGKR